MRSLLHQFGAQIAPDFEEVLIVVLHVALVLLLAWAGWWLCSRLMRLAHERVVARSASLDAINRIAELNPPIRWRQLELHLRRLTRLGFTMKVWGRLLCLVRPDLYCTVSSLSVCSKLAELLGRPQASFGRADGYVELIQVLHESPWFNSKEPRDKSEAGVWRARVAFMDPIFYG